jgi:DNA repair exonuclease SbcCD ATPase subunit
VKTLTYTGTLVVSECPVCGTKHAFPQAMENEAQRLKTGFSIFCPAGHRWHYLGETEAQTERRLRKQAEDRLVAERARADGAEASLRATKGHVTRLRKRVLDGECPLCGQRLRDVSRHVRRVHGDVAAETEELA